MPTAKLPARLLLVGYSLLMALGFVATPAQAGTGDVFSLPLPGRKIKHNARLEVETTWVAGTGYRPVKVTIINSPLSPTTYDRDFRVVLRPRGIYTNYPDASAEKIVEMPEGSTSGTVWISVPQTNSWQNLEIRVYEGGQPIPELSEMMRLRTPNLAWGAGVSPDTLPSALFIDSDTPSRKRRDQLRVATRPVSTYTLPDISQWQLIAPIQGPAASYPLQRNADDKGPDDVEILRRIDDNETIEMLPFDELPETWIDFTCLDLIVISLGDAQALAQQYPARWEAILKWAAVGCTLIIYDVGDKLKKLAEVDKLCQFPSLDEEASEQLGWREAEPSYATNYLHNLAYQGNNPTLPAVVDRKGRPFAIRPLMLGRVVAMSTDKPLENPPSDMLWLLNQVGGRNWLTYQRNGYSPIQENFDFVNFLVAGTGRVPVFSFLVLISLFSIAIGPVNYLLLKRWRRLYLLLVTVPLGAIIVSACLFSYALISDGLGVRLRARSYTQLDQSTGQMTSWARQSYYAGVAPGGGLRFPTDAAVFAIDERPTSGGQRERVWNEQQQLRSGYISSRRTAQFLVQNTGPSTNKLEIQTTAGQPPRVKNLLGAPIEHLLLRDKAGEYYSARAIEPNQEITLTGTNLGSGSKAFSTAYFAVKPAPPDGYQLSEHEGNLWGFEHRNSNYYYAFAQANQRGLPSPSFASSILEIQLQRVVQGSAQEMIPGTYRAMLVTSPEMPLGYAKVRESGSFHMLEGRW